MQDPQQTGRNALAVEGGIPARSAPIEATVPISAEARRRVLELLDGGIFSSYYNGVFAREFEREFQHYHDDRCFAVAVNSGTSALHLAVTAAGFGPGDEVIVPALCFVAAASVLVQNGAVPIICDADSTDLTMDVERAERLISARTRGVLPVHFWGAPTNSKALRQLCDHHGLILIEDCAQALGAAVGGQPVGTFGDYGTYAFSVRKHVACGEGGMVVCRNTQDHDKLRQLSNYGKGPGWDDYISLGYSYRMAEFPAIIALDGLHRLDQEIVSRQRSGRMFQTILAQDDLHVVAEPSWGRSVYFKCPVLLPADVAPGLRERLVTALVAENVSCRIPHRPLYEIPWLAEYLRAHNAWRGSEECPVAAAMHARLFEIETGPNLSMAEAETTCTAVRKVWHRLRSRMK